MFTKEKHIENVAELTSCLIELTKEENEELAIAFGKKFKKTLKSLTQLKSKAEISNDDAEQINKSLNNDFGNPSQQYTEDFWFYLVGVICKEAKDAKLAKVIEVLEKYSENILVSIRKWKVKKIKDMGLNPYPYKFEKTHTTAEAVAEFVEVAEGEEPVKKTVTIAGRMMSFRRQGKTVFGHLQDENGKIQLYISKDEVGEEKYEVVKMLDIGDIIGVSGWVFKTKTGEISVCVEELELLTKNIRPIPVVKEKVEEDGSVTKFDAFTDKEERYRKRYLDLVINPENRDTLKKRLMIIQSVKQNLMGKGFLEVETPILQTIKGGAAARPFVTHHNALDMDLFLRIAPELHLKRIIAGGIERVFEMGKTFRNEGISMRHNPEFTLMELYQSYADYNDMMDIAEDLIKTACLKVNDTLKIKFGEQDLDLSGEWRRLPMVDSIKEYADIDVNEKSDEELKEILKAKGVEVKPYNKRGEMISMIFEEYVEHHLMNPTFIIDYPVEISPLTKSHRTKEGFVERFELFINGWEIGNAYSELNDPEDQLSRFEAQLERAEGGDDEAEMLDEDFVNMLEVGMPPTGGLGIGIDRMVMILTNQQSIRDVIFFPHMRNK